MRYTQRFGDILLIPWIFLEKITRDISVLTIAGLLIPEMLSRLLGGAVVKPVQSVLEGSRGGSGPNGASVNIHVASDNATIITADQSSNSEPKSSNRVWLPRLEIKTARRIDLRRAVSRLIATVDAVSLTITFSSNRRPNHVVSEPHLPQTLVWHHFASSNPVVPFECLRR